jgi:hypothetical protein
LCLMAGDKSYANLWLIPFVPFSLSPIHTQFPYTQKINFPPIRKKKKLIPPSIVFIDSCGVGAVAR